jgi:hypothetical protein
VDLRRFPDLAEQIQGLKEKVILFVRKVFAHVQPLGWPEPRP